MRVDVKKGASSLWLMNQTSRGKCKAHSCAKGYCIMTDAISEASLERGNWLGSGNANEESVTREEQ